MKTRSHILLLYLALFLSPCISAQPGHNIPKQPKISIPKVINIPQVKVHANSNSVFRTPNTHPDNTKNTQPKKDDVKREDNDKEVKQKKGKKQKR